MVRIAIFDDNRLARHTLAGMLRLQGHHVNDYDPTALFEALRVLREEQPELVMVDLMMPQCPGMTLVRAIQEDPVLSGLRIIVVSGATEPGLIVTLTQLGILGFITKPLDAAEVERHVSEALQCDVPDPGRTKRVAVIHAQMIAQALVHQALAPSGYQVLSLTPSSMVETLGFLVSDPPDLVLIALSLVAFPALSLVRAIREDHRLKDLPILLLMSEDDEPPGSLSETLGINALIPYPCEPLTLQGEVRKALDEAAKQSAASKPRPPAYLAREKGR
jgi:two-component system chemotaxis response regulator CheY